MRNFLTQNWSKLTDKLPHSSSAYFEQLITRYTAPDRHYHNLKHIETLLQLTEAHIEHIKAPETLQFAIWYHDAIYDVRKDDNEERSADLAREQMSAMGVDPTIISDCTQLIIATKDHTSPDIKHRSDAHFLLDIDLSILAAPMDAYNLYTQQIRKEYDIYSDAEYKEGRRKVIQHFLNMDRIYKTELFFMLNEDKARRNLLRELDSL